MATDINDTEEQVLALLCGDADPWSPGGTNERDCVTFDKNGTGALNCAANQSDLLACGFNWSFNGKPSKTDEDTWKIPIQITLTTRLHPTYYARCQQMTGVALQDHLQNPPSPSQAPWAPLHSAAFRPKQYTLTLSRGRFIDPIELLTKGAYPIFRFHQHRFGPARYAQKLVFDVSPYPPREEWIQDQHLALDYPRYWEYRDFVREQIQKKDETWAETLDLGWWLSPTVGERHDSRS